MKLFVKGIDFVRHRKDWEGQVLKDIPDFWSRIEACQPMVYHIDSTFVSDLEKVSRPDFPGIDAPFSSFSIEFSCGSPVTMMSDAPGAAPHSHIYCLYCFEIGPKEFKFCAYGVDVNKKEFVFYPTAEPIDSLDDFIKILSVCAVGSESTREVLKIGSGSSKMSHRIRRIVHVMPKRLAEASPKGRRLIDFSHRFNVRGHWRKIRSALGKDRVGDYTVSGFTWVVDHERGPDDMPLIKKTRLLDSRKIQGVVS